MNHFSSKDFSRKTVNALNKKGITFVGSCAIPDMTSEMPYANASRGYELNDNGCMRIRSYFEVKALAGV